jgi:hypothetical protein
MAPGLRFNDLLTYESRDERRILHRTGVCDAVSRLAWPQGSVFNRFSVLGTRLKQLSENPNRFRVCNVFLAVHTFITIKGICHVSDYTNLFDRQWFIDAFRIGIERKTYNVSHVSAKSLNGEKFHVWRQVAKNVQHKNDVLKGDTLERKWRMQEVKIITKISQTDGNDYVSEGCISRLLKKPPSRKKIKVRFICV